MEDAISSIVYMYATARFRGLKTQRFLFLRKTFCNTFSAFLAFGCLCVLFTLRPSPLSSVSWTGWMIPTLLDSFLHDVLPPFCFGVRVCCVLLNS